MRTAFISKNLKTQKQEIQTKTHGTTFTGRSESGRRNIAGAPLFTTEQLADSISSARDYLLSIQDEKGYWVFDLEADATIPSEYILLQLFLGRKVSPELKSGIANYLRNGQLDSGGWSLFKGGEADISASVKAYFALKLLGDGPGEPHMIRARELILKLGGAAKVNVFTRITLALFGQIPWHTTPAMPIEIMLLPGWFFFHLHKISYWSRTVIVPLLILYAKRPVCNLTNAQGIAELFVSPPEKLRYLDSLIPWKIRNNLFILLDRILRPIERFMPHSIREKALKRAEEWTIARMKGEGGIGAIFPAMANAVMALKVLDYPEDHPDFVRGVKALDDLLIMHGEMSFCQPCNSPIWDSCWSLSAALEANTPNDDKAIKDSVDWLFKQQIFVHGDWNYWAGNLEPGGWAFQFENSVYPDVDDTPAVLMALLSAGVNDKGIYREKLSKAVNWVLGMQSSNGGWGAFDVNNNYLYLNEIPFADHGALLDPSTSDLTGRCIELLAMLGYDRNFPPIKRALKFLRKEQEDSGAWYGRWGVNYIYGTWSVLMGLGQLGEDMNQPYIRKAVEWLKSCQNDDKGWGETCYSYSDPSYAGKGESTASQTAWALLGLMAAGEVNSIEVQGGIHYLLRTMNKNGSWDEEFYTGTGFPKVFFLLYHGYSQYFPLLALGSYQRLRSGKKTCRNEVKLTRPADLHLPVLK